MSDRISANGFLVVLGGVSRVGKSSLAELMGTRFGFEVAHGDGFAFALEALDIAEAPSRKRWPDPSEYIAWSARRNDVLVRASAAYAKQRLLEGRSIVLEGAYEPSVLFESTCHNLGTGFKAAYFVNTDGDAERELSRLEEMNENVSTSWLRKYSQEELRCFCRAQAAHSREISRAFDVLHGKIDEDASLWDLADYGGNIAKMSADAAGWLEQAIEENEDGRHLWSA